MLLPAARCPQACPTFVTVMQVGLGVVLPVHISMRRESRTALEFARRHGVPEGDWRLQAYRWMARL